MVNTPGAVVSKAILRDSLNRLRSIRSRCGKDDDEKKAAAESTGDPFRDKCTAFGRELKNVKELISERNAGTSKFGQDTEAISQSHEVNKSLRQLETDLTEIHAFIDQAERELAKANKKKKKPEKIALLERQLHDRENVYNGMVEMLNAAKEMNAHRFDTAKGPKTKKEQLMLGKKMQMREQLMNLNKQKTYAPGEGAEGAEGGGGGKRSLQDDPETAQQMKALADQEKKINAGLDRLAKGVGRLHELACQIGSELETQNTMLDNTEAKVDTQTKQLKQLNKRLKKLIKDTAPMNVFLNVGCFLLLLGLVGYFPV